MSEKSSDRYAQIINRVCDYICAHLDDDLSVEKLSRVAHFSKYHFHRQFAEYAGINVARYVLLSRLKRASYQLAFDADVRIIDIALTAGFENPESFSRAFKKEFGRPPSQFRSDPKWTSWSGNVQLPVIARKLNMDVKIVDFETVKVALLAHRGSPAGLNDSIARFIDWRKQSGLSPKDSSLTLGIAYDDPETTEPDKFRWDIAGSVKQDVPENPQGVYTGLIPGGRCAMILHQGPYELMSEKINHLYAQWLPASGEQLRDFPCFFNYLNLMIETEAHELKTEIYLPLQ